MKIDRFDVLIVGAGPAGSFAAERLARGGVNVVLFDGRPEGEPKACGGGVTAKALKAWPHLLGAVGRTVDELEMYSPSGRHLHLQLDEPFAIYSRVAFDSYLRERARAAGAKVVAEKITARAITKTESGWTLRGSRAEWSGKILVGADGANSVIARMLLGALPKSEMGIAFGYLAPLPKRTQPRTIIAFLPGWRGYAWAFPRIDHVSFGIAISQNDFSHPPLDELLWGFMIGYYVNCKEQAILCSDSPQDHRLRKKVEANLRECVQPYAARVPQISKDNWQSRQAVGANWALIGDAAGFVDPITDEGIYYALRSGELFAEAYAAGDMLQYQARWSADFGKELSRASGIRNQFYGNLLAAPFTERMIDLASVHRGIKRTLAELISGDRQYVGLKRSLAARSFWPFGSER